MRTQKELGRQEKMMKIIISDGIEDDLSLSDALQALEMAPDILINIIYKISYNEMTHRERKESKEWIKNQFAQYM